MCKTVFLSKAKIGKIYSIKGFSSNLSFYEKERLLTYGFIENNTLKIIRKSIFGNTFQINISGGSLVIRRKEANTILLQESSK
jgi:Fe2+ transport system protein FeoA